MSGGTHGNAVEFKDTSPEREIGCDVALSVAARLVAGRPFVVVVVELVRWRWWRPGRLFLDRRRARPRRRLGRVRRRLLGASLCRQAGPRRRRPIGGRGRGGGGRRQYHHLRCGAVARVR